MPSGARATLERVRLDGQPEDTRYRWTLTVQHATPADWTVGVEDRVSRLARRVGLAEQAVAAGAGHGAARCG